MREFSKVYQNVWTSRKFRALPDDGCRLLYLYVLTCKHSNSSGCYDLEPGYAMADLKWPEIAYQKAIDSLSIAGLVEVETDLPTVLITKWTDFNEPTNAKHALSVLSQLDAVSSLTLKHKRGQEFTRIIDAKKYTNDRVCGQRLDSLCNLYRYPIDSLSAPRLDQEVDQRERQDLDLDQTRPERRTGEPSQQSAAPDGGGPAAAGGASLELLASIARLNRRHG